MLTFYGLFNVNRYIDMSDVQWCHVLSVIHFEIQRTMRVYTVQGLPPTPYPPCTCMRILKEKFSVLVEPSVSRLCGCSLLMSTTSGLFVNPHMLEDCC